MAVKVDFIQKVMHLSLYYRKWKLTIWHHKKEIPDYLEEMEE